MNKNNVVELQTAQIAVPTLTPELDGLRLFLLSDLHMHAPHPIYDALVSGARAAKPNLILCCGDVIDEKTHDPEVLRPVFRALRGIAPIVAVNGNNDARPRHAGTLRRIYADEDVTLLENDERRFVIGESAVRVVGMQTPEFYAKGLHKYGPAVTELEARIRGALPRECAQNDGECAAIVLTHRPETAADCLWLKPDLICAGHAHGGQIRLFGRGLFAPGQGFFPKYTGGVYDFYGAKLAVCRGVGNHALIPRINNSPHAMVLSLCCAEKRQNSR